MQKLFKPLLILMTLINIGGCDSNEDESFSPEIFKEQSRIMYIAHAGGGIDGQIYSNSKEALDFNYGNGHRLFELDFELTSDVDIALIHDWNGWFAYYFNNNLETSVSIKDFLRLEMNYDLTQLGASQLVDWLLENPSAYIVTDIKADIWSETQLIGLEALVSSISEKNLLDRFIIQIYRPPQYQLVKDLGFDRIILTLYAGGMSDEDVLNFAQENDLFAITMPSWRANGSELDTQLNEIDVEVCAHTINEESIVEQLFEQGVNCIYTDFLLP